MKYMPNEFTDDERIIERNSEAWLAQFEKEEEFDLDDCTELDVGVVLELMIKFQGAKTYREVPSGFELYDKHHTYLKSLSVKNKANINIAKTFQSMRLKKVI